MIRRIFHSIKSSFAFRQINILVYFIQLLVSLVFGAYIFYTLDKDLSGRLVSESFLTGFNFEKFNDYLIAKNMSISELFISFSWLLIVGLLISVFMNGGMLNAVNNSDKSLKSFWISGSKYFKRFFIIGVFTLVLTTMVLSIVLIPITASFTWFIEAFETEKTYVFLMIVASIISLLFCLIMVHWSIKSRYYVIDNNSGVSKALLFGFRQSITDWKSLFALFLFAILFLIFYFIYVVLNTIIGIHSVATLLIFISLQQGLSYLRVTYRLAVYRFLSNKV